MEGGQYVHTLTKPSRGVWGHALTIKLVILLREGGGGLCK